MDSYRAHILQKEPHLSCDGKTSFSLCLWLMRETRRA